MTTVLASCIQQLLRTSSSSNIARSHSRSAGETPYGTVLPNAAVVSDAISELPSTSPSRHSAPPPIHTAVTTGLPPGRRHHTFRPSPLSTSPSLYHPHLYQLCYTPTSSATPLAPRRLYHNASQYRPEHTASLHPRQSATHHTKLTIIRTTLVVVTSQLDSTCRSHRTALTAPPSPHRPHRTALTAPPSPPPLPHRAHRPIPRRPHLAVLTPPSSPRRLHAVVLTALPLLQLQRTTLVAPPFLPCRIHHASSR